MPCAMQPSLEQTRAIADILFTQFARQRFNQAGLSDEELNLNDEEEEAIQERMDEFGEYLQQNGVACRQHTTNDEPTIDNEHHQQQQQQQQQQTDDTLHHIDRLVEARPIMASYGRELRRIAEQFEQTRLRQQIKMRANEVQLNDIHRESFTLLLEELFTGGVTRERIVILFFFCTDVALKAVSMGSELVTKLLRWSLLFIKDQVCLWVHKIGGWDAVLCHYVPSMVVTTMAILGICALTVYIKKNLWS